jgi:hypothetical protein
MIPKNKRRTITVNNQKYEWACNKHIAVFIKNLKTGKALNWHLPNYSFEDSPQPKPVTPSFIKKLIIFCEI